MVDNKSHHELYGNRKDFIYSGDIRGVSANFPYATTNLTPEALVTSPNREIILSPNISWQYSDEKKAVQQYFDEFGSNRSPALVFVGDEVYLLKKNRLMQDANEPIDFSDKDPGDLVKAIRGRNRYVEYDAHGSKPHENITIDRLDPMEDKKTIQAILAFTDFCNHPFRETMMVSPEKRYDITSGLVFEKALAKFRKEIPNLVALDIGMLIVTLAGTMSSWFGLSGGDPLLALFGGSVALGGVFGEVVGLARTVQEVGQLTKTAIKVNKARSKFHNNP